jgi:hypothetical protein
MEHPIYILSSTLSNLAHLLPLACGPTTLLLTDCLHGIEPSLWFASSDTRYGAMLYYVWNRFKSQNKSLSYHIIHGLTLLSHGLRSRHNTVHLCLVLSKAVDLSPSQSLSHAGDKPHHCSRSGGARCLEPVKRRIDRLYLLEKLRADNPHFSFVLF